MLVGADKKRIELSLLLLRLGVFLVMAMWTADKIMHPEHASKVFENFYFLNGLPTEVFLALGCIQGLAILCFLLGVAKRASYGAVLLMHFVSTVSAYQQYLTPYEPHHLLFFAAWPMLAACFALYYLRDFDSLFSLGR